MNFKTEYEKYDWKKWTYNSSIGLKELKKGIPAIPPKHGVYIISASKHLGRVNGKSKIIYIGQSGGGKKKGKQGIGPEPLTSNTGRLFNTRGDEWVRENIERMFPNEIFVLECFFTKDNEDPKEIESDLLKAYAEEYFELPPANNQSFKRK